jgi:hypothetical protein
MDEASLSLLMLILQLQVGARPPVVMTNAFQPSTWFFISVILSRLTSMFMHMHSLFNVFFCSSMPKTNTA